MSQALATDGDVDRRISAAVLGLIAQRRLTVAKVAILIGVSRTTMYHRVNNERPWEAGEVERLAQLFEVSRDSLYEGRAEFATAPAATVAGAGTRSSTDRASDYGSRVGHFRRPRRRRWSDRPRELSVVPPLRLVVNHAHGCSAA